MQHSPMFSLHYQLCEDAVGWKNFGMLLTLIEINALHVPYESNYVVIVLVWRKTSDEQVFYEIFSKHLSLSLENSLVLNYFLLS